MDLERVAQLNQERLSLLHPRIQVLAKQLIDNSKKQLEVDIYVTQGLRTIAEQDALYAQGRTDSGKIVTNCRGGYSWHNFSLAFDIAFLVGKDVTWEGPWEEVGGIGETLGLIWGGHFKSFTDQPHFEYHPNLTLDEARAGKKLREDG